MNANISKAKRESSSARETGEAQEPKTGRSANHVGRLRGAKLVNSSRRATLISRALVSRALISHALVSRALISHALVSVALVFVAVALAALISSNRVSMIEPVSHAASARAAASTPAANDEARPAPPFRADEDVEHAPPLRPDEEVVNSRPLVLPLSKPKIVIEKKARRLTLYSGGERVRVFRVALGFAPEGDKEREGDGRTPEGEFYVCMKNERSRFYLSLGLSYPDTTDAERGLRDGLITRAQYRSITRAISRKAAPPWNTPLGGEIFIHGGGAASDWTLGCVALANEQMKQLFDAVPLGTPVVVEP